MPKTNVQVTVNFNTTPATAPDVTVSRANNSGITWTANKAGYTFTGVTIGDNPPVSAPTGDFGAPQFGTAPNGNSTMTVTDGGTDLNDYTYAVTYTTPTGEAMRFDPLIKNRA